MTRAFKQLTAMEEALSASAMLLLELFPFLRQGCCLHQHTPPSANIKERKIIAEAVNHFFMFIADSLFNDAPIEIRLSW